ncbi:putative N-acetyltransferase YvbK [BD1-7 clade bacterium]|uniref:Putative N-acetyltransferase YvbK n=1 Tax=BD1-7 clade bacterium TaxID=2029982 RepID=A0A5S9PYT1_9GAMM|nr:putative N-acetyltransferase YvbK [BD1-7 clade bacterium]
MKYYEATSNEIPMSLLLEADPSESSVNSYLSNSLCFVAKDENDKTVGACVLKETGKDVIELFNISVGPNSQSKGIGSGLLQYVIKQVKIKNYQRMELGTGTFGYQLTFYQRLGFRVETVLKDYFIKNYPEPIFENGIQHKDMLRLYLDTSTRT